MSVPEALLGNPREVYVRVVSAQRKAGKPTPPVADFGPPKDSRDRLLDATIADAQRPESAFSGASDAAEVLSAAEEAGIL